MSEKLGVLLSWLDSIEPSNEYTFDSIDALHEFYGDSTQSTMYQMSKIGFRRLINQIIDWNLNKKIRKCTRRNNSRNVTTYFISSKSISDDDNIESKSKYIKDQNTISESSPTVSSNLYTGEQLSIGHISNTSPSPALTSPSISSPALTSPALTSPAISSPAITYPGLSSYALVSPAFTPPSITTTNKKSPTPILSLLSQSVANSVNAVITEIVKTAAFEKRQINFNYSSNGKKGLLVNVPVAKNKDYLIKYEKRTPWLLPMLAQINASCTSDAAEWMIELLLTYYNNSFEKFCEKHGYYKKKQLDTIATAAMWTESNVSNIQTRIILRHLRVGLGYSVTVSEENLRGRVNPIFDVVKPTYGSFLRYSNPRQTTSTSNDAFNDTKKPEEINYWVSNPTTILAALIQQRIGSTNKTYGYPKVSVILGADHGGGSSKFVFRVNLESPTNMRDMQNIDSKSLIFQFANITCKKDTGDIISLISKEINDSIHDIKYGRMVGVRNIITNKVKVVYLPTYSSDLKTEYIRGKLHLSWLESTKFGYNNHMLHEIDDIGNGQIEDDTYHIWEVIPGFNLFITGDLAFYATISGRENYSSCGCPYCNKTRYDWQNLSSKDKDKKDEISLFRIKQIHRKKEKYSSNDTTTLPFKTYGVKTMPLWDVEPTRFIIPLLHLEIGMVNKAWSTFTFYLRDKIDYINNNELIMRNKLQNLENDLKSKESELMTLKTQLERVRNQQQTLSTEIKDVNQRIRTLNTKLIPDDKTLHQHYTTISDSISKLKCQSKETILLIKNHIHTTKKTISSLKSKITDSNRYIKKEMSDRECNEYGLDCMLEKILKVQCRIYPQAFHGGEMNGVCCKRLLQHINEIFDIIKKIATKRLQHQIHAGVNRCLFQELTSCFELYHNLFRTLDHTFSLLRIPGPNEEEIDDIRKSLLVLESLWREIKISITPKAHVMFVHTLEQVIDFDGIADKVEDYVEKAHQIGNKLNHFTSRLKTKQYSHKQDIQIKRMLLHQDNDVKEQIISVRASAKRQFKNTHFRKDTAKKRRKLIRMEQRDKIKKERFFVTANESNIR